MKTMRLQKIERDQTTLPDDYVADVGTLVTFVGVPSVMLGDGKSTYVDTNIYFVGSVKSYK